MSILSHIPTRTGTLQPDHEISLVDASKPLSRTPTSPFPPLSSSKPPTREPSPSSSAAPSRHRNLRQELVRRKYSRFQSSRYSVGAEPSQPSTDSQQLASPADSAGIAAEDHAPAANNSRPETAIDILYENQRGYYFFGIPLFSSKSLMGFDAAAWTTATRSASPVDVNTAQVPDPSWQWAWRSWYVDMGEDVDADGWQYSLAFGQGSAWHGTHVWFHSFVRRRRWLRRRVRASSRTGGQDPFKDAHLLNAEYFTIHPEQSRDSMGTGPRSNPVVDGADSEVGEDEEEVADIGALMQKLKSARIDREKKEAVTNFVEHGGDELIYLVENMDQIMGLFIFQQSRRETLAVLFQTAEQAKERLANEENSETAEKDKRLQEVLRKAIDKAEELMGRLEFSSDVKGLSKEGMGTPPS
ncbi:MAG: hypothetical protein M1814_005485 [Vezdaea aestivalis]|nr:MAG: hypothetical protein M1814_005485 [Vezdaea aestivalis]